MADEISIKDLRAERKRSQQCNTENTAEHGIIPSWGANALGKDEVLGRKLSLRRGCA